jgi:hypothetical protein
MSEREGILLGPDGVDKVWRLGISVAAQEQKGGRLHQNTETPRDAGVGRTFSVSVSRGVGCFLGSLDRFPKINCAEIMIKNKNARKWRMPKDNPAWVSREDQQTEKDGGATMGSGCVGDVDIHVAVANVCILALGFLAPVTGCLNRQDDRGADSPCPVSAGAQLKHTTNSLELNLQTKNLGKNSSSSGLTKSSTS